MKTIFKDGVYDRVDNEVGELRVNSQGWAFKPKSEYKKLFKPKTVEQEVEQEKKEATLSEKALRR